MTEAELNAIEARVNAATPGPWSTMYFEKTDAYGEFIQEEFNILDASSTVIFGATTDDEELIDMCVSNSEFIAYARTDIPLLLAEVRRLQAALEESVARLGRVRGQRDVLAMAQALSRNKFLELSVMDARDKWLEYAAQEAAKRKEGGK